jgi:cyclophilin family peptidyl-prolyl cis-trans isomerase
MDIKISLKKSYFVNGKTYHSLEEMPADIRNIYETPVVPKGAAGPLSTEGGDSLKINFNGRVYSSPEELPADARELYGKALSMKKLGVSESATSQHFLTASITPGESTESTSTGGLKLFLNLAMNIAYYSSIVYFFSGGHINTVVFVSLAVLPIIAMIFIRKSS